MIKKIIISACLLLSLVSFAQEGTSSPYSFYGIGDIKFKGTVENRSMGSLSVFPDSIHINIQNPAHLASLKLTGLAIGGILGILFAPEKGTVTRQKIMDKGNDYADELKSKYNDFADTISEKLQSAKEFAMEMSEDGKAEYDEIKNMDHTASKYKL